MTVTYINNSIAGLTNFGTDLGGFFSNLLSGVFPGLMILIVIGGIGVIFGAIAMVIVNAVKRNSK